MTRFDTKPLRLGCGIVVGLFAVLNIMLLALLTITVGLRQANYHGNVLIMMFFSMAGGVVSWLLIRSASKSKSP